MIRVQTQQTRAPIRMHVSRMIFGRVWYLVWYLVIGESVYFRAHEDCEREEVIDLISYEQGVHWSSFTYFDLFIGRLDDPDGYELAECVLHDDDDEFEFGGHLPTSRREFGIVLNRDGNRPLSELPEEVRAVFSIR